MNKPFIDDMREAANIVTTVLLELKALTKPDVSLDALDEIAERMVREHGAEPYNKGYKPDWAVEPYPATLCTSVNHEVCHAPPRGRTLREGDIVKYDLGIRYKSGCGDAALTVAVGEISNRKARALRYGLEALKIGIAEVRPGARISAIGRAIDKYAMLRGYVVIKEYGGHYIGKEMHEEPHIPHVYDPKYDEVFMKEGDVLCIEPILTPGSGRNAINVDDKWTAFLVDREPAVMFEHMVLVTKDGHEVLTKHL